MNNLHHAATALHGKSFHHLRALFVACSEYELWLWNLWQQQQQLGI